VLCGFLWTPYIPDPGSSQAHLDFMTNCEVRHTAIRVITAHLREGARHPWSSADLDFTGVVFDGGISGAFSSPAAWSASGMPSYPAALSGTVDLGWAKFCGTAVIF